MRRSTEGAPRVKIQFKPGTLPQGPGSLNEKDVRS
jgi:hypothetical protein